MLIRLFIKSDVKSRVSGWAILLIIVLIGASAAQTVMAGGSLSNLIGNTHLTPLSGNVEVKENITTLKIVLPSGKVKVEGVAGGTLDYEGVYCCLENRKVMLKVHWKRNGRLVLKEIH